MRHSRQATRYQDRGSRNSTGSALAGDALERILALIAEKPMMSVCVGVAAGFVLGKLIPRSC